MKIRKLTKNTGTPFCIRPTRGLILTTDSQLLCTASLSRDTGVFRVDGFTNQASLLDTKSDATFRSWRIGKDHPDMLLNEFGAWPFEVGGVAFCIGDGARWSLASPTA